MPPKSGRPKGSRRSKRSRIFKRSRRALISSPTHCPTCNHLVGVEGIFYESSTVPEIPFASAKEEMPKPVEFPLDLLKIWLPALFKEDCTRNVPSLDTASKAIVPAITRKGPIQANPVINGKPDIVDIVSDTDSDVCGSYGSIRKNNGLFIKTKSHVVLNTKDVSTTKSAFKQYNEEIGQHYGG
jgi:hypothetical protein